jgi:hypothetical protein
MLTTRSRVLTFYRSFPAEAGILIIITRGGKNEVFLSCLSYKTHLHIKITYPFFVWDKFVCMVNVTRYDCLCGLMVGVPGYRSRGPDSIPGATRFSEK